MDLVLQPNQSSASLPLCVPDGYLAPEGAGSRSSLQKLRNHSSIRAKGVDNCPYELFDFYTGTKGITHYHLQGERANELVIMFHGLNGALSMWERIAKDLAAVGYLVLTYDLYGHGLSDNPRFDVFGGYAYTLQFFVDQLVDLLHHLQLSDRPHSLIGFSLGAVIAVAFGCHAVKFVRRVILIAPAGAARKKPRALRVLRACSCCIPCSGCCIRRQCLSRKNFMKQSSPEDRSSGAAEIMWQRITWNLFAKRRTVSSILGTVCRLPLFAAESLCRRLKTVPVLILWGRQDNVAPCEDASFLLEELVNAHLITWPDATHMILAERSNECAAVIATFLDFPNECLVEDFQYLLPFDSHGDYRVPRTRKPPNITQVDYFETIGYRPKRWFRA